MTHEEIEELLGAYALDAVERDEAEEVERHLLECPRCRSEVASYREVAALMGNYGGDAPAGIWERITGGMEEPSSMPALRALPGGRPTGLRRALVPVMGAAVAAAVVALALVGIRLSSLDGRINHLQSALGQQSISRTAVQALLAADTRKVVMTSGDDRLQADLAVRSDGQTVIAWDDLPVLPPGRTYQMWGLVGHAPVSLGITGRDARNAIFRIDRAMSLLMITDEPAGGVPRPGETPVLVQGSLAGVL